jgi:hypothetical protein
MCLSEHEFAMCLPNLDHNWPRYVLPTGTPLLLSDGFLPDPDSRYGQYSNQGLLTLEQFFNRRCCILLGDAGIGKSDVLRKEYERVRATAPQHVSVVFRSLRDFGSDVTAGQFSRRKRLQHGSQMMRLNSFSFSIVSTRLCSRWTPGPAF